MKPFLLEIIDLYVTIENKPIIKGLNLQIEAGKTHAIMGPNGVGKSTLSKVLAGHPDYDVPRGKILFLGENLLELEPEERARLGLFTGFQYPIEIAGISNFYFLFSAYNAHRKGKNETLVTEHQFEEILNEKMQQMAIPEEFKQRNINEGFSGGEKKRNEILQMALLDPRLMVLDETDSGLDVDAMKLIAFAINQMKADNRSLLLITHYQRLLNYIKPDFVHVMIEGKIAKTGGAAFALELEEKGYDWIESSKGKHART